MLICHTHRATVVERPHIWFMDDGQLTKTLCPEMPAVLKNMHSQDNSGSSSPNHEGPQTGDEELYREPAAGATPEVEQCCACDDAKYEVRLNSIILFSCTFVHVLSVTMSFN